MEEQKASNATPKSASSAAEKLGDNELHSIYRTSRKVIQEYVREIERHNRYRSARADLNIQSIMDNRGPLIDLYEACMQQDAHIKSVIETLESQVLGERYMLAKQSKNGQYVRDVENSKKIQGTQFIKIIKGILEAKLYGYTLIEINKDLHPATGKLLDVNIIERRNVLPDQNYVVKRQGQFNPGWNISHKQYAGEYVLVNNGDLGMFSATTPLILAKKFTFANYVGFAQTYGQPIIQGKSADESDIAKQQLANDIANSSAQRIIVTGLNDDLSVHALAMSNSEKIFTGVIDMANSEVSNLVLGSESMAGATQSYVGSTNAHQDIFRDRIEVYREYIENVMNEEVIPRLVAFGMIPDGLEFKYSNKIEMGDSDRIKLYDFLTNKFEVSPEEISKEFGVTVGKQFNISEQNSDMGTVNNKKPKEKKEVNAKVNFLSGKEV